MEITLRALITMIHGMLFGAFFLMAIYGLVVELYRSAYAEQPRNTDPTGLFSGTSLSHRHGGAGLGRSPDGSLHCLSVVSRRSARRRYRPGPLSAVSFEIERHDRGMARPGNGVERTHCLDRSHRHDHGGLCLNQVPAVDAGTSTSPHSRSGLCAGGFWSCWSRRIFWSNAQ